MKRFRENLLVQFSVVSFVVMAVIAVVLAIVLSNRIRSDAVDALAAEAIGTVSERLLGAITPADLEVPMTGERYDGFHEFVQKSIVSERTARVKLWAKDGTLIYSDEPAIVGNKFLTNQNLLKALRGQTAIEIAIPTDPDNAYERYLGTLMEVYTPVIFPGAIEPQGSLEIYQYYEPTAQRINDLRRWLFGSIGVGFVVLYGGLVSIVWGGWRTINRQQVALARTNADLGAANEELHKARERLEERAAALARSNAQLEQFAYVASHDLQEPLRMVASYTQLLARRYQGKLDSDADEFIAYAVDGATRMQALVNDLLAYSRVGTHGKPFEPTDCEVIFNRAVANLQATIGESGAEVTHDALPTVVADASQLGQVFQNLIGNAVKFHGEDPPRVHVSAQRKGKEWLFSVRDNGIGIDPQYVDRIFAVFQRLHTRTEYPGTGMGLAICKRIVERHGGQIWVESEPGEGATFYFTIPTAGDKQS